MAAKIIFPLSPETLDIRRILGDADNLHGKVDAVQTKTDNLPADTSSVLSTIDTEVGNIQSDVTAVKAKTDNLPADTATALTTIDTVVDGIKAKTDNLPADTASVLTTIDSEVGDIKAKTDNLPADTATVLSTIDTVVDAIQAKTDNLPADTATVLSTIDTEVGNLQTDVTSIKTSVGTPASMGGGTDTLSGMLQSLGGVGFAASDSLKDVKAAVLSIQNNTSFTASIVPIMEKPETGSNDFQALVNLYDGQGSLVNPDLDAALLKVVNPAGDSRNANLFEAAGQTTAATKIAIFTVTEPTVAPTAGATYEDSNDVVLTVIGMVSATGLMVSWTGATTPVSGTLTKASGTGDATLTASAIDASYVKLKKDASGQYSVFYNVGTAATKENLSFRFGYFLAEDWKAYDRASAVQDYEATASVAGEVWNQLTSAHTGAGSYGLLVSQIAGTDFATSTDSLHALKGRLDTIDSALSTIDTEVGNIQSDVTAIKTKTDNLPADTAADLATIDGNIDDIEAAIGTPVAMDGGDATLAGMLRKLFDDGAGFDATTDSLAAISDAINAQTNYPTSFAGSKTSNSLAQSASQTLEFSTSEGIINNNVTLLQLKVLVTAGDTTSTTVQVYEKTGNPSDNLVYEVQGVTADGINIALPNLIFRNADAVATNKVYVKITNVTDAGNSTYSVQLRGLLNSN